VRVRFRPHAALAVVHRRGGNVHAAADAVGDSSNLAAPGEPVRRKKADVGKQNVTREISAFEEQTRRDPALASSPARDCRRREELLSKRAGCRIEVRYAGHALESELAVGGYGQLHRALDPRSHGSRTIEIAR